MDEGLKKRIDHNEISSEPNWREDSLTAYQSLDNAMYAVVFFYIDEKERLELRIRRVAFEKEPTGIGTTDIYQWLYETGKEIVGQLKGRKTLLIESKDVENGLLQVDWTELTELPKDEEETP
ncbi:hypothetical protein JOC54_001462 [Alkalihalobacillus xiaoxiensis]|uniref:Uncharacterized protein n=1 Tax=Shouchella xiaoxiensis TaxID=766895 RepID=A0ABS2SSQ9_9BACI|nr:hypothetical protein [Shouchella xiaoxiensis]MBM7838231.1 hypothetical protein [Shouchella xiaoxiensis]